MNAIRITDPDDPRVAPYRDIRERDLVGRQGLFVAEGKVVLNVLFGAHRFGVESVLLLENRLAGMADTLALAPAGTPLYVAGAQVMDRIAGFHMHRGVLAIGKRRQPASIDALLDELPADALVLALVGISNHDNMGAIFRNAAAFGADAVLLDPTSCDPLYRKAIRVSVGAALKVPFTVASGACDLVDRLGDRNFACIGLSPAGESALGDKPALGPTALFLGAEGPGLPLEILERLSGVRIRMAAGFDSLNVAAASAIALHHFAQRRLSAV